MKKLLRPKDLLMLALAEFGDVLEETRDPFCLVSSAYETMYGFIPKKYQRNNFYQTMRRSLKTGDIELLVKNGKQHIRLTSAGKVAYARDFSLASLTKTWNKKWIILSFDIEEKYRRTRDKLRTKLRSIGFGMLQESVWVSPLPIGKEVLELMDVFGLSENTFVMEVSHLLLGDPVRLARSVWHLDSFEVECNNLIERLHDREVKRREDEYKGYRKKGLELLLSLPPVPQELLPQCVGELRRILF